MGSAVRALPSPHRLVKITIKYDFGWDKRGNGFKYDSHSGRGSMMGNETNKILGFDVLSNYCAMCARGLRPDNHFCPKNVDDGVSSKGFEPLSATKLIVNNPDLEEANVIVDKFIGDRDSSTMAALRRESDHPIEKIVDLNHNGKGLNRALWDLKKSTQKWLTTSVIDYLKRAVGYAIKQNKGNVPAVRAAILNVEDHTFGRHGGCGDWCMAKEDPDNYVFRFLKNGAPFNDKDYPKTWGTELKAALTAVSDEAESLAPCGSTQQNESFNHQSVTRAPKSKHYCGTNALYLRVSCAVCSKNLGSEYTDRVFQDAGMSPSCFKTRAELQRRRVMKALYQERPDIKRRRLHLKMKNNWHEGRAASREGLTYVSGQASVMERASEAASATDCYMPRRKELSEDCKLVTVDIETTGLHATAEIVQIAATCGNDQFSVYMLPLRGFTADAAELTKMRTRNGHLYFSGKQLQTTPPKDAARQFLDFLKKFASQVLIVGHNVLSFDAPRILKFLTQQGQELAKEFVDLVFGFTDTMTIIKQGTVSKLSLLAQTYLTGPEWKSVIAHDALGDCIFLDGLLKHFKVSETKLKEKVLPVRDFLERQVQNRRRKVNTPELLVLESTGVSKFMIKRMASMNVTLEELRTEYAKGQRRALEVCLAVSVNGKPRVTAKKYILDKVEAYLKLPQ